MSSLNLIGRYSFHHETLRNHFQVPKNPQKVLLRDDFSPNFHQFYEFFRVLRSKNKCPEYLVANFWWFPMVFDIIPEVDGAGKIFVTLLDIFSWPIQVTKSKVTIPVKNSPAHCATLQTREFAWCLIRLQAGGATGRVVVLNCPPEMLLPLIENETQWGGIAGMS